jgi:hypothetical protein
LNDKLNGFARVCWYDGDYYIGELKDNYRHGKGKYVYKSGEIEDGIWEKN